MTGPITTESAKPGVTIERPVLPTRRSHVASVPVLGAAKLGGPGLGAFALIVDQTSGLGLTAAGWTAATKKPWLGVAIRRGPLPRSGSSQKTHTSLQIY